MVTKLYRKKYIISIFDSRDYLYGLVDNEYEFAEFFEITLNHARSTLSDLFNHKIKYIKYKGKRLFVYFILDSEEI